MCNLQRNLRCFIPIIDTKTRVIGVCCGRPENDTSKWDKDNWASPEQRQMLAYTILVELLAYQFASPVRWSW
jgi:hypothetical protein